MVYSIAPSRLTVDTIWAGTDDGLIQVTRDGGKTWKNVTPPAVAPWSKIAQLDASHFDDVTVYAAVNRLRVDDLKPHIFRTHDGGATWTEIVRGLPDEPVNTVREDPVRKGLLFAGTENGRLTFHFNDGDDWQPAAHEHARNFDPRSGDPRQRSGCGHPRPRLLGPRRHRSAAPIDAPRSPRAAAHLFAPSAVYRFRATPTPIRRCRPKSRRDRIRPMARSCTTT